MADGSQFQKKKKKKVEDEIDRDAWMVTFSDLLQLLITFFVLLISMSSMDKKVFKEMFAVFTGGVGVIGFTDETKLIPPSIKPTIVPPLLDVDDFKALINAETLHLDERAEMAKELDSLLDSVLISGVEIERRGRHFAMVLSEEAMFEPGSNQLSQEMVSTLEMVNSILSIGRNKIIISGHTDDRLHSSQIMPSNWELSAARSMAVFIFLANKGDISLDRMEARGYAGYHPKVKNISDKYRKRNRRIEIMIKQYEKDSF